MARIGYARVSTNDQHPEAQADQLTAAGCARIFTDEGVSGKLARRPEWDACLDHLRSGDVLVITKLDRAGRSVKHLVDVGLSLRDRGIDLVVIQQGIDTTTAAGRLMFHVLAAIAEFEADLISERTRDGLEAARTRGRTGGRKRKMSETQVKVARGMLEERAGDGKSRYTGQQVAEAFGVSRATLYARLGQDT